MAQPGIEPRSPRPLVNTQPTRPMSQLINNSIQLNLILNPQWGMQLIYSQPGRVTFSRSRPQNMSNYQSGHTFEKILGNYSLKAPETFSLQKTIHVSNYHEESPHDVMINILDYNIIASEFKF